MLINLYFSNINNIINFLQKKNKMKKTIISLALLAITGFASAQQKSVPSNPIDKTAVALAPKQNQEQNNAKMEEIMKKMAEDTTKAEATLTPMQKKQRNEDRAKANDKMEEMMKKIAEDNAKTEAAMTPEQKQKRELDSAKAMDKMSEMMKNTNTTTNSITPQ